MCFWGQRMSFSPRVPLTLPVLKITVKLTGLLMCFAILGPWDQPHKI